MTEQILRALLVGGSALGAGVLALALMLALGDTARIVARLTTSRRRKWLDQTVARYTRKPANPESETRASSRGILALLTPSVIAASVCTALALKAAFTGSIPIALFFVLLGFGASRYLARAGIGATERNRIAEAVTRLVDAFRSTYLVSASTFHALEDAAPEVQEPRVSAALDRARAAYRNGQAPERALALLDQVGDAYLAQFAFILRRAPDSDARITTTALDDLARRLAERRRIAGRLRIAMASVNATVRFLEAANIAAVLVVLLHPFWWEYYVARPEQLIGGMVFALVAVVYFDLRAQELAERTL